MPDESTEPRIFVEVMRPLGDGTHARCRKEISLVTWVHARYPGAVSETAINTALAELGYKP